MKARNLGVYALSALAVMVSLNQSSLADTWDPPGVQPDPIGPRPIYGPGPVYGPPAPRPFPPGPPVGGYPPRPLPPPPPMPAPLPPAPLPPPGGWDRPWDRPGEVIRDLARDLDIQASQLDSVVRFSTLSWDIKSAVSIFAQAAGRADDCFRNRFDWGGGVFGSREYCRRDFYEALAAFDPVNNYLVGVYYSYPQIYQEFLDVRAVVDRARAVFGGYPPAPLPPAPFPPGPPCPPSPGPFPPPAPVRLAAVGNMDGYSFSLYGFNAMEIYNQCLNWGSYNRINYIRTVQSNGLQFGSPYSGGFLALTDACRFVANSAR